MATLTLPEIKEKLRLIRTKICSERDNESNWSNLVNIFEEVINNITNVVHLQAWAGTDAEMCEGALDPVPIVDFDPWYDPADFPDITTPTEASNTLNFEIPSGTLVLIEYNRAEEKWEITEPIHERKAIGETLTYVNHALILSRYSASLPKPCTAVESTVAFGPVSVLKTNQFSGLSGAECILNQVPTTIYLPEEDEPQDIEPVINFTAEPVVNDVAHFPGDGIYVNDVIVYVACAANLGPRKVIDTGPCQTSGGSGG